MEEKGFYPYLTLIFLGQLVDMLQESNCIESRNENSDDEDSDSAAEEKQDVPSNDISNIAKVIAYQCWAIFNLWNHLNNSGM